MPVFSDGQKISAALAWDRMIQSVPASYVVWKDGSTYRAECLLKGGTDYSGTDVATVLQSAIDATTQGGKIVVKLPSTTANYIDSSLTLKSYVNIDFANSYLYFRNSAQIVIPNLSHRITLTGGIFRSETTAETPVIAIQHGSSGTSYVHSILLNGMKFVGGKTYLQIEGYGGCHVNLDSLMFYLDDSGSYSPITIKFHGYGSGMININNVNFYAVPSSLNAILWIENDGARDSGSNGYVNVNNLIVNGKANYDGCGIKIKTTNSSLNYMFFNNIILGKPTTGVSIEQTGSGYISVIRFTNVFTGMKDSAVCTGFDFPSSLNDVHSFHIEAVVDMAGSASGSTAFNFQHLKSSTLILDYHDVPSGGTVLSTGADFANNRILGNYHFVNSGTATISSSTYVDVTHHLAGTPTVINVTPATSGTGDWYLSNIGDTTFRINVANSGTYTFYWTAEYNP